MVQNSFCNFEPHAKALQTRGDGSPQVVYAPRHHGRGVG